MANRSILIVEDDARLRAILVRSLERGGHRAYGAATMAEARAALAVACPDVLLVDIDLPDGTGWELLREQRDTSPATVIVMSAGQPARSRLAEFQPTCFLGKPFAIDTLLGLIEHADTGEMSDASAGTAGAA